jgi:hypothetical protein
MDEQFAEDYRQYKDIIDKNLPKDVIERLLGVTESKKEPFWEPEGDEPF